MNEVSSHGSMSPEVPALLVSPAPPSPQALKDPGGGGHPSNFINPCSQRARPQVLRSRKGRSSAVPTGHLFPCPCDGHVGDQLWNLHALPPTPARLLRLESWGCRGREGACLPAPGGPACLGVFPGRMRTQMRWCSAHSPYTTDGRERLRGV